MLSGDSKDSGGASEQKRAAVGLSVVRNMQDYITRIISVPGMKALVLDGETTSMVSLVYSQTDIINREVFLVERMDQSASTASAASAADPNKPTGSGGGAAKMHHLKAVCFIRPERTNLEHFKAMLSKPKYKEYHIFFSNVVPDDFLKVLAEADEFELIRQIQEYYGDFFAVNPNLWHLNLFETRPLADLLQGQWTPKHRKTFDRNVSGIVSSLLSMKRRPIIRYSRGSELAHTTASAVGKIMREENALFHFGQQTSQPLLLILDRRDDPVTPLLLQWTYQAMVHELLGLINNRLDMSRVRDIRKDLREVVLSSDQDAFFRSSMNLNYGDLGASIKDLVEAYQRKTKTTTKLESIADMQKFVENYPEFKQMSGNVSKHVAIMTEISRIVDSRDLMEVSTLEQELACTQDHSSALEKVLKALEDHKTGFEDKVRVSCLYALRYETEHGSVANIKNILRTKARTDTERQRASTVIDELLAYAGQQHRSGDLFGNKSLLAKASKFFTSGLKGVENVFSQHKPLLLETLTAVMSKTLKPQAYPYLDAKDANVTKHEEVFVYIMGGVTYEEALHVTQLQESKENTTGIKFILGGSCIHNSTTFIDDVLGWAEKGDVRIDVSASAAAGSGGASASAGKFGGAKHHPKNAGGNSKYNG